jgi:glycolate oxidase FAD binding subunit
MATGRMQTDPMETGDVRRPGSVPELAALIAEAARSGARLELRGGGSKAAFGAPVHGALRVDMGGFAGLIDYDPAELVLTAGAATPLHEIEALLAGERQMLAFEPFDCAPLLGAAAGRSTIGGVIASGLAGSRRLSRGSVRDHLLGFEAVSGRAEAFVAGGKVVKNVTGYDLPKLLCGSWGRLAALTRVTLKVVPAGRAQATQALHGLDPGQAMQAMALAMGSQAEVAAAAHCPPSPHGVRACTALRVEGFAPSVAARCAALQSALQAFGSVETLPEPEAGAFWSGLRTLAPLQDCAVLWRVNVPPSRGPAVIAALEPLGARWLFDWAGGLVWLGFDGDPPAVRAAAASAGGHAMLVRAPEALRARVPALHPLPAGVAALEERIRRAFDPQGVFETGRFG